MGNKGFEAALTAVEMANLREAVAGRQLSVASTNGLNNGLLQDGLKNGPASPAVGKKTKARATARKRKSRS
jgi:hypothetical protein